MQAILRLQQGRLLGGPCSAARGMRLTNLLHPRITWASTSTSTSTKENPSQKKKRKEKKRKDAEQTNEKHALERGLGQLLLSGFGVFGGGWHA
jgi:hypothetical protein